MATNFQSSVSNFNPYVQEIPDSYFVAGMVNQQKYEAGVQKVQSYLDTVNGLPVAKESQKRYLQSRVGELSNAINTQLSGADFRNAGIVNQVGYYANKLASDPIIQGAIASSQRVQQGFAEIAEAKKKGENYSPSNEWDFNNQYQGWMADEDPRSQFNGTYTPYRDVRKKAMAALKELNPDAKITDTAITTDKNGNLTISDAVLREQFKGVSPERIQQAIYSTLDAADMRQLDIDGRYSFSNITPDQLRATVDRSIKNQLDTIKAQKKRFSDMRSTLTSIPEKNAIEEKIANLNNQEKAVYQQAQFFADTVYTNPEAAKAQLYTNQFITGFSNAFGYTEVNQEYRDNPFVQVQLEREKATRDWEKFKLEYEQKERFHRDQQATERLKAAKEKEEGDSRLGGVTQTVESNKLPDVQLSKFIGDTQAGMSSLDTQEKQFLDGQGKDKQWLAEQRKLWDEGKAISPLVENYFATRVAQEKEIGNRIKLADEISREADKNIGIVEDTYKDLPNIRYTNPRESLVFSPKELADFNSKLVNLYNEAPAAGPGGAPARRTVNQEAVNGLSNKERILFEIRQKMEEGRPLSPGEKVLQQSMTDVFKRTNSVTRDLLDKRSKFMNEQLIKRTEESRRIAYEIPAGKEEEKAQIRRVVQDLQARATDQKDSYGSNTIRADVESISKLVTDPSTSYSLVRKGRTQYGDAQYWIRLSGKGEEYQDIPLSPDDKRAVFGDKYEDTPESAAFAPIRQQLSLVSKGSTNWNLADEEKAPSTAYLDKYNFRGVQNFSVKGDVIKQGNNYALRLYIYDPLLKKYQSRDFSPNAGLMDEKQVLTTINGLQDSVIYELLYDKQSTAEEMEAIKRMNRKPD